MAESKAESDRRQAEADHSMAELKKTVERTSKALDSLTTRWGRFVEELVEPAAIKLFRVRGINVTQTFSRGKVAKQGVAMEIDILAVDGADLVALECKSRLSKNDVDYFMEKLKFKKGLFVIKPSGDMVEIVNDAQFQGRKW